MPRFHEAHHKSIKKREPEFDKKKLNRKNNSKRLRTRYKRKKLGKLAAKSQKHYLLIRPCQKKSGTIRNTIPIDDFV